MSEEERSGRRQSERWPLEALERLYDEAVCHGADATGGRDGGERYAAPLDLLASSTIHVPQLVLLMAVLEEASEAADADVTASGCAGEVAHCSAGLIRLGQRALQAHARDVGYDPDAWRAEAVIQTAVALSVGVVGAPTVISAWPRSSCAAPRWRWRTRSPRCRAIGWRSRGIWPAP